ncbi:DUF4360 domain-containing protein [Desulfobulbus sp. F3]|nr:DUF4360 domain-containing protein [Desulfobulbus sp. F3]
MKKIVVFALAVISVAFAKQGDAQVVFQAPMQFAGTGCQPGSYSFSGQASDTLTVLFSAYDAAKPRDKAASKMENTACSFVLPVQVPPGFQVAAMTADWRGYAEGSTQLFREYFIAGQRGPQRVTSPRGNYTESDNLMRTSWGGCKGGTVPLRINSRVRAAGSPSYIAVDTLDLQNQIVFHVVSRACR